MQLKLNLLNNMMKYICWIVLCVEFLAVMYVMGIFCVNKHIGGEFPLLVAMLYIFSIIWIAVFNHLLLSRYIPLVILKRILYTYIISVILEIACGRI